jgi:hypothetical protein
MWLVTRTLIKDLVGLARHYRVTLTDAAIPSPTGSTSVPSAVRTLITANLKTWFPGSFGDTAIRMVPIFPGLIVIPAVKVVIPNTPCSMLPPSLTLKTVYLSQGPLASRSIERTVTLGELFVIWREKKTISPTLASDVN